MLFVTMDRFLTVVVLAILLCKVTSDCDTTTIVDEEGIIGATEALPWLGVLNVYLYMDNRIDTAMTGVVLIHKEFAIVHADDVARIPDKVFLENSSVMFYIGPDVPWYCRPLWYYVHPEYIKNTFNSIALLQLDMTNVKDHNLKPICWVRDLEYNPTDFFVVGYTDENVNLEKEIRRVDPFDATKCDAIYETEGLNENNREPVNYLCYYSKKMKYPCIWENGMVLVQSTDEIFYNLVGFGVHGPGCMSPARFIDLEPYYDWLSEIIFLRTEEIRKANTKRDDIPLQEINISPPFERRGLDFSNYSQMYDNDIYGRLPKILLMDVNNTRHIIEVFKFKEQLEVMNEGCKGKLVSVFDDWTSIGGPTEIKGVFTYTISLHDLPKIPASCIRASVEDVKTKQKNYPEVTVEYMEVLDLYGDEDDVDYSPKILSKITQKRPLYETPGGPKIPHLFPEFLSANDIGKKYVKSYVIYFTFPFKSLFKFVLEIVINEDNLDDDTKLKVPPWWRSQDNITQNPLPVSSILRHHHKSKLRKKNLYRNVNKSEGVANSKPKKDIMTYIKESAIPKKERQYSFNAVAKTVYKTTSSLKMLIFTLIFGHVVQ